MTGQNAAFDECTLSRIEDAGINASAPPQQRWLDGWLVRFSPGKAKRARCVNALADGRLPLAERLAACGRVYTQAGLPLIVRVTPFSEPAGLDEVLEAEGLRRFDDTRVMVLGRLAETITAACGATASLPIGISVHRLPADAFAERVGVFRGSPVGHRLAQATRMAQSPVPHHAFELRRDGEPVACGQFAIEDETVGLYDVFTATHARGHGVATLLCRQLLTEAASLGAELAYLQVEADNHSARAVYHRLGFVDGYSYHYRTRDPSAA
jgi:GNAT superfamily N-acetyltransferase